MLIKGCFGPETLRVDRHAFEVDGAQTINIALLEGAFEHVLVIVKDPKGAMRALITFKTRIKTSCIAVDADSCTNGCLPGPLPDGTWTLEVVRTYPIEGEYAIGVACDLGALPQAGGSPLEADRAAVTDPRTGWYKGDFHAHSAHTDGRVSHEEVAAAVERERLEFFAMSDHSIATTKFPETRALVLPSTEVTWDDNGHYNIHGLRTLPDYGSYVEDAASKSEALDALFKDMRAQGCVLSLNHPFPHGWTLEHDFDIRSLQLFEVINAPHLFDPEVDNDCATRLFDFLWSQGHLLMAVGGSDAHKKNHYDTYPIGIPATKVHCAGLSIDHVLEAAVAGHAYVQVREDFELALRRPGKTGSSILPGDRVQGEVELKVRCTAPVIWELYRNGSTVRRRSGRSFTETFTVAPNEWWRIQARDEEGQLLLFANPVHDMQIEPVEFSFQALLHAFYAQEA